MITLLILSNFIAKPPQDTRDLIKLICAQMRTRYVIAETGEKAASVLEANLAKGNYDTLSKGTLAAKLAEDLNAVCKDAHLRVRYSDSVLPARKVAEEPSEEERRAYENRIRTLNAGFQEVKILDQNLGYIKFTNFFDLALAQRAIDAAFGFVAETDGLIFDIRENGGGEPDTVRAVCSYLFSEKTHLNSLYFREGNQTLDFFTQPVNGKLYADKPIWVLVSKRTGSAAEEFSYNLQTRKRATIIGQATWGGANPGGNVRLNDHFSMFVPTGMAINPVTKKNWEGTGVIPDIVVEPGTELQRAQELAKQPRA